MRFSYCPYEVVPVAGGADVIYRPVIRIRMKGPRTDGDFWALLDTGADESYITLEMADYLGVVTMPDEVGTVESASGTMTVKYGDVGIEVEDGAESYAWNTTVGIVEEPWSEAILGHRGMLSLFDVTFLGADKEVLLVRNHQPLDPSLHS